MLKQWVVSLLLAVVYVSVVAALGAAEGTDPCSQDRLLLLVVASVATLSPLYCGHELCSYDTLVLHVEWQLVMCSIYCWQYSSGSLRCCC